MHGLGDSNSSAPLRSYITWRRGRIRRFAQGPDATRCLRQISPPIIESLIAPLFTMIAIAPFTTRRLINAFGVFIRVEVRHVGVASSSMAILSLFAAADDFGGNVRAIAAQQQIIPATYPNGILLAQLSQQGCLFPHPIIHCPQTSLRLIATAYERFNQR
jgi:hypothetical protein